MFLSVCGSGVEHNCNVRIDYIQFTIIQYNICINYLIESINKYLDWHTKFYNSLINFTRIRLIGVRVLAVARAVDGAGFQSCRR